MMRIGRCRNGGGRVGEEGWIYGNCIREEKGGLVCLCMNRGLLKAFLTVDYVGIILCFNGSCLANSLATLRDSRRAKLLSPRLCARLRRYGRVWSHLSL